jgi:hypothetical protein
MFSTEISASRENRLRRTSVAQLPLFDDLVTELASFGVKIWLQMRAPSPLRLAAWRSVRTCPTSFLSVSC